MKKTLTTLTASIFISLFFVGGSIVSAQVPEPMQVQRTEIETVQPTSGFVDDNGNPISIEDYEKISKEEERVKWERIIPLVVVVAAGVIATVVILRNKKKQK